MLNYLLTEKKENKFVVINVLYTLYLYTYTRIYTWHIEWQEALIWKPWILDTLSEIFHDSA
jgi:hypothetical protein